MNTSENLPDARNVAELTVGELRALIRAAVHEALAEAAASTTQQRPCPLDLPTLSVGPWPEGLQLLSREEYYEDVDR